MKKKVFAGIVILALVFGVLLSGCDDSPDDNNNNTNTTPEWATGFYNFPTGRVDNVEGRLTINNLLNSEVLLFYEKVDKDRYIGTVGSLGTVRVKMPEQNFYSIIAVQKSNYIERRGQAAQFHEMAYYSNTQAYTIAVSPSSFWGGAIWRFNNHTKYWVEVRKSDLTENYAVIQPDAKTVNVPIPIDQAFEYSLFFSRELKYNGMIIAKVETTTPMNMGLFQTSPSYLTHVTDISASGLVPDTKPFVMVINNSSEGVRVFYSGSIRTNGSPSGEFIVNSGQRALFSGFEPGDDSVNLNFRSPNWGLNHRYVPESQSMPMLKDKVYEITIPSGAQPVAADITVTQHDAVPYFGW